MTARRLRRAAMLGLVVLVAIYVADLLIALATSREMQLPGGRITVEESPGESLSASFEVVPLPALAAWVVVTAVMYVLQLSVGRRRAR